MKVDINFVTQKREVCDCMMGCLENAALYYNLDYQYLYRGIWVFRFDEERVSGKPFWKRLFTPELVNSHMQLELHHGLRLLECPYEGMDIFIEVLVKELLQGNPVIVFVDAFYCPWSGVYKKGPLPHYCLLTGYDEETKTVLCADPYFMKGQAPWPIEELKEGIKHYYLLRVSEPIFGFEHWKSDVLLCAKEKNDNQVFDSMMKLKNEIISDKKFIEELRHQNDHYSFELFYIMKYIGHSRYNHAEFLRYVALHQDEAEFLIEAAKYLEQAAVIWKKIGLVFTKLAYLNSSERIEKSLSGISEKMEQAIFYERQAMQIILSGLAI